MYIELYATRFMLLLFVLAIHRATHNDVGILLIRQHRLDDLLTLSEYLATRNRVIGQWRSKRAVQMHLHHNLIV